MAEAAHNVLVEHITSGLLQLIHKDMASNIAHLHTRPKLWEQLLLQHRAIGEALRNRKSETAMRAAGNHVDFVRQNMAEHNINILDINQNIMNGFFNMVMVADMTATTAHIGLDMIDIPGGTTAAIISGIIADEAAIGIVNNKTTAVRLVSVAGKNR